MTRKRLFGIVCANITPMDIKGELDLTSLKKLVDHMAVGGIHGVYPTGTNGEGLLLTKEEQHAVAKATVEANAGRMSAFVQCATMRWEDTMENVAYACSIGADGVGVMTPTFFSADESALEDYYTEACRTAGEQPVYVYNIPQCTGNDVSPALFGRIIDQNPNAVGIKYSQGNIPRIQDYLYAPKSRRPDVLIGADKLIVNVMAAGGTGEVSGPAAVLPKLYAETYNAFVRGELDKAQELQSRIIRWSDMIASVPQIPAIKAMLHMMGIIETDCCRLPLRKLRSEEYRLLEQSLNYIENGRI